MSTKKEKGFTIVELLFSTAIFSVVLLLCLSSLVQIGRMYYRGVTTAQTQQSARALLDELSQAIQFSGALVAIPADLSGSVAAVPTGPRIAVSGGDLTANAIGYFCIGSTRYTFLIDRMQDDVNNVATKSVRHALWADEPPGVCASASPASLPTIDLTAADPDGAADYKGRDLLSDNMRLTRLKLQRPAGINNDSTYQILLTVAYGDDDLLIDDPANAARRYCKGAQVGTEFCAISELSTIIKRRVQ